MRPGFPIRLIVAALTAVLVAVVLVALLMATDTMLSIWQRLDRLAPWASTAYLIALIAVAVLTAWLVLRMLTGGGKAADSEPLRLDRDQLEQRLQGLDEAGADIRAARLELDELDRRGGEDCLYLAVFGQISAGKSSLINALLPGAAQNTSPLGGTTRQIRRFDWQPSAGLPVRLVDLPGVAQPGADQLGELARGEALRAHVVIYVCDGDLTREQHAQVAALAELHKPLIVALNKVDQFDQAELTQIQTRLAETLGDTALAVVPIQAGGQQAVTVVGADGSELIQQRPRPPQVSALVDQIIDIVGGQRAELESQQALGGLALVAARLRDAEQAYRHQAAMNLIDKYSRRAVIGALAALTPGSDLVIQGALATRFIHQLCALYEVSVRDVDLDRFLTLAGGKLRRTTAVILAVAGNALKAFPGLGTVAGGLVHAVAYGMIFDSLGRSVASALEQQQELKPAALADRFEEQLVGSLETRAGHFVRLALTQLGNRQP